MLHVLTPPSSSLSTALKRECSDCWVGDTGTIADGINFASPHMDKIYIYVHMYMYIHIYIYYPILPLFLKVFGMQGMPDFYHQQQ